MKVSVVIPTCKRAQTLRETLEALTRVDYAHCEYEVIVVDDVQDRDADTWRVVRAVAEESQASVRVVGNAGGGAAAARNTGARLAQGELILFCDDDMVVGADHLRRHVSIHERNGEVVGGGVRWYSTASLRALESTPFGRFRVHLERRFDEARGPGRSAADDLEEVSTLPSCDMSVGRGAFWRIGGFDESFPFAGAEDQDFCIRAARAGMRLLRDRQLRAAHNDLTTTLAEFGMREERGAHTVLRLVRKWPETLGAFRENEPMRRGDPLPLLAKKGVKALLSGDRTLRALHRLVTGLERTGLPDRVLWRIYDVVIGLHIFRGYRDALSQTDGVNADHSQHGRPGLG